MNNVGYDEPSKPHTHGFHYAASAEQDSDWENHFQDSCFVFVDFKYWLREVLNFIRKT